MIHDSARVSVRLRAKDWKDLVNFVSGDLDCMPEDDEIRMQMDRILLDVNTALATAELKHRQKRT